MILQGGNSKNSERRNGGKGRARGNSDRSEKLRGRGGGEGRDGRRQGKVYDGETVVSWGWPENLDFRVMVLLFSL